MTADPRKRTIRTAAALAAMIVGLSAFDRFLAASETRERQGAAAEAFRSGSALLRQGHADRALDLLRKAYVLERRNPDYALALGNALAKIGKNTEAGNLIDEALDRKPNDGEANLSAARLQVQEGDPAEAEPFYHRAIYGDWRNHIAESRTAARLEFIELLRKENNHRQMLAELISLEGEAGEEENLRRRLAPLFLEAGSPQRAADAWRNLTQSDANDRDAWAGLGEAELVLGQYREARSAFRRAAAPGPEPHVQSRIDLLDSLIALDPTPRNLTSIEKYRRSRHILELILSDVEPLVAASPQQGTAGIEELTRTARTEISRKEPAHVTNELSESLLALAQQLWQARIHRFGMPADAAHEPLRRIMERIAA